MIFSSSEFIFFFLPAVLLGYYMLLRTAYFNAIFIFLLIASFFFYAWWKPAYLPLMLISIGVNYVIGSQLLRRMKRGFQRKAVLWAGVALNLLGLGFFKYLNFFLDNVNLIIAKPIEFEPIILPLAISFFTFQQIAFLVDSYKGYVHEYSPLKFALFVSFFPQLIAGPIVHHAEVMPQFRLDYIRRRVWVNIGVGLAIFTIGLFKKVVIADTLAYNANTIFDAADVGVSIGFVESWIGALSYTFQLYFDFSGYADMAIGAARMFGIRLPANFNSPYKSVNIIDFWRRWNMTLSRFLRDYLYIGLGGNRLGAKRRLLNIFITMLLGGLWHGAGWTFVLWGAFHGGLIVVNQVWRGLVDVSGLAGLRHIVYRTSMLLVTFIAVVLGWVLFRATTMDGAFSVMAGMAGVHGFPVLADGEWSKAFSESWKADVWSTKFGMALIPAGYLVCILLPNTQQLLVKYRPTIQPSTRSWLVWRPNFAWTAWTLALFTVGIFYVAFYHNRVQEFIYFNF